MTIKVHCRGCGAETKPTCGTQLCESCYDRLLCDDTEVPKDFDTFELKDYNHEGPGQLSDLKVFGRCTFDE